MLDVTNDSFIGDSMLYVMRWSSGDNCYVLDKGKGSLIKFGNLIPLEVIKAECIALADNDKASILIL
jgi:hypothetical protein